MSKELVIFISNYTKLIMQAYLNYECTILARKNMWLTVNFS